MSSYSEGIESTWRDSVEITIIPQHTYSRFGESDGFLSLNWNVDLATIALSVEAELGPLARSVTSTKLWLDQITMTECFRVHYLVVVELSALGQAFELTGHLDTRMPVKANADFTIYQIIDEMVEVIREATRDKVRQAQRAIDETRSAIGATANF